jgi:hypothetical protein
MYVKTTESKGKDAHGGHKYVGYVELQVEIRFENLFLLDTQVIAVGL